MRGLSDFQNAKVKVLFSDIDGTLTTNGQLGSSAYEAVLKLSRAGIFVVPVTGRPAGWCELIARQWPVHGGIGENGAFYFRHTGSKMKRNYLYPRSHRTQNKERFKKILTRVKTEVPRAK